MIKKYIKIEADRNIKHNFVKAMILTAVLAMLAVPAAIGAVRVDLSFRPTPGNDTSVAAQTLFTTFADAPGGKYYALISYGLQQGYGTLLYRLNGDGSVDNTFNCFDCAWSINSMLPQPDGKILVAGNYYSSPVIWRLTADGAYDPTFSTNIATLVPSPAGGGAGVVGLAADGSIYAFLEYGGFRLSVKRLYRLSANGVVDTSFTPTDYAQFNTPNRLNDLKVLPDGKLLVSGETWNGKLFRLNTDGTKDTSLESPSIPPISGQQISSVNNAVQQPDGKIVFAGYFNTVNGLPRISVVRLNADGSVNSAISDLPLAGAAEARLRPQSSGKMIVFGAYTDGWGYRRINPDLSTDNTFNTITVSSPVDSPHLVDSSDRLIIKQGTTYKRYTADGSLDPTFDFSLRLPALVTALAPQADGKTVVAGEFTYMGNTVRNKIARIDSDGINDPSYDPGAGFDSAPSTLIAQPDGRTLAYGAFTSYNGTVVSKLVRINSDGSVDSSFNATLAQQTQVIALQPDGKILVGGINMTINGVGRTGLARLNSDGTTDTAFSPILSPVEITTIIPQADGKIVFAGAFSGINGFARSNMARLNADGTLDTSFNAGSISSVGDVIRSRSGKYLVYLGSQISRRNSDGTNDASYTPTGFSNVNVHAMVEDNVGGLVVGGNNQTSDIKGFLARIKPNGGFDSGYFIAANTDDPLSCLAKQPNGKIIAGGTFTKIDNVVRPSLARLNTPGHAIPPFDFNGDGKSDFMVTRPSDYNWHLLTNATYNYTATAFGSPGDKVVPGDYDGDGKTDIAIWRPSTGDWWYKGSATGNIALVHLGNNGDTAIPSDVDGNGKTDFVTVSPSGLWQGIAVTGEYIVYHQFGQAGDKPVAGDFDGDGKFDLAYFRPSNGTWYYNKSSSGVNLELGIVQWGLSTDIPAPADYDGDGKTDVGVFRPSEGNWYVLYSGGGYLMVHFGATGDKPIPADYDGDGKADVAAFRPSDGYWYQLPTTGGYTGLPWGISSDIPAPNALIAP